MSPIRLTLERFILRGSSRSSRSCRSSRSPVSKASIHPLFQRTRRIFLQFLNRSQTELLNPLNSSRALGPPGGSANHFTEIHWSEDRILVGQHICFDVPKGGLWLVLNSVIEGLDNVFLEMSGAGVRLYNRLALSRTVLRIRQTKHIHLNPGGYQGNNGVHMLGNTGRRVQSNRGPDGIDIRLSDPVPAKEIASGICAIDFEPFVFAAVFTGQPHVVKHRPDVEQLRIKLQATVLTG